MQKYLTRTYKFRPVPLRFAFACLVVWGFCFTAALPHSHAVAAEKSAVAVQLAASKVITKAGSEALAAAATAKPGDLLQYEATYRNTSDRNVANLQATLPIPAGVELVLGSAKPAGALGSVDGKTFAPLPLKRTVTTAAGKLEEQLVPASEIRALRWSVPALNAGAQIAVSARTRVLTNLAATR